MELKLDSLQNEKGKLCTVLNEKYIITEFQGKELLIKFYNKEIVSDNGSSSCVDGEILDKTLLNFYNANFIWMYGTPVHYNNIKGNTEVSFDALFIKNKGFYVILAWNGNKPKTLPRFDSNDLILKETYSKLPIIEIKFKDRKTFISVIIKKKILEIPFTIDKIYTNGNKIPLHFCTYTYLASHRFLADICEFHGYSSGKSIYHCVCITVDCNFTLHTFEIGMIYSCLNENIIKVNKGDIFYDVILKLVRKQEYVEIGFTLKSDEFKFTFENNEIKLNSDNEERVAHLYIEKETCYILMLSVEANGTFLNLSGSYCRNSSESVKNIIPIQPHVNKHDHVNVGHHNLLESNTESKFIDRLFSFLKCSGEETKYSSSFSINNLSKLKLEYVKKSTKIKTSILFCSYFTCALECESNFYMILKVRDNYVILFREYIFKEKGIGSNDVHLKKDSCIYSYVLLLPKPIKVSSFEVSLLGLAAWQGKMKEVKEKVYSLIERNLNAYWRKLTSTSDFLNLSKLSLQVNDGSLKDNLQSITNISSVKKDKEVKENVKMNGTQKTDACTYSKAVKMEVYNVTGYIKNYENGKGLLLVEKNICDQSKLVYPCYCYFSKEICYITKKGDTPMKEEHLPLMKEHIFYHTVFNAKVYRCKPCTIYEKQVNFSVLILWRLNKPAKYPLVYLLPRSDSTNALNGFSLNGSVNNIPKKKVSGKPELTLNCKTKKSGEKTQVINTGNKLLLSNKVACNDDSIVDGLKKCKTNNTSGGNNSLSKDFKLEICEVTGTIIKYNNCKGIFAINKQKCSLNNFVYPCYSYFSDEVCYITKKGDTVMNKTLLYLMNECISCSTNFKANVYRCKPLKIYNLQVNFSVLLLWKEKKPSVRINMSSSMLSAAVNNVTDKKDFDRSLNPYNSKTSKKDDNTVIKNEVQSLNIGFSGGSSASKKDDNTVIKNEIQSLNIGFSGGSSAQNNLREVEVKLGNFKENNYKEESQVNVPEPFNASDVKKYPGDNNSLLGSIIEVEDTCGKLLHQCSGNVLSFIREKCFLFGVTLSQIPLTGILQIGDIVKFSLNDLEEVEIIWLGGTSQDTPKLIYENIIDWCKKFKIPKEITLKILSECSWIPPSCKPILPQTLDKQIVCLD